RRLGDVLFAPNFVCEWESDLWTVTRNGYSREFEIKISHADFKADFSKFAKHEAYKRRDGSKCANYFYYCSPRGIIAVREVPAYAGLIEVQDDGKLTLVKKSLRVHGDRPPPQRITQAYKSL